MVFSGFAICIASTVFVIPVPLASYAELPHSATSLRFSQEEVRDLAAITPLAGVRSAADLVQVVEVCVCICMHVVLTAVPGIGLPIFEGTSYAMCVHS